MHCTVRRRWREGRLYRLGAPTHALPVRRRSWYNDIMRDGSRRRSARATARVIRPGTREAAALEDADETWWESVPLAERMMLAFRLSVEQWRLHGWEAPRPRGRLSRSVAHVRRSRGPLSGRRRVRARGAGAAAGDGPSRRMDRADSRER